MVRILFVCLGNICRSPTARAVFEHQVEQAGLQGQIQIDSAGTAAWHEGKAPDPRTQEAAHTRGYAMSHYRARQVREHDFKEYDYLLAMDKSNQRELLKHCPQGYEGRVKLFLEFAEELDHHEVPDPYHGGPEGFELVLDLVESASKGLLSHIKRHHLSVAADV